MDHKIKFFMMHKLQQFTPYHQYLYSSYSSPFISFATDKENWFNNQSFLGWWSFPWFSWSQWRTQQYYCKEKLHAGHSLKGLKS